MQVTMNYPFAARPNRPKAFAAKHLLQVALFVAFGLWLLYQTRLSYTKRAAAYGGTTGLSHERVFEMLGRKGGGGGWSKSTRRVDSGVTLDDVTNPVEEGEIVKAASADIEEVEFGLRKDEVGTATAGNDGNETRVSAETKPDVPADGEFADENGIPQHVRDGLANGTRVVVRSMVAGTTKEDS